MDRKETKGHSRTNSLLSSDEAYYKYIFKKTEKIVCAVFYLLEHTDKSQRDRVISMLEEAAIETLRRALGTLSRTWYGASRDLVVFSGSLTSLASALRVARASGLVATDATDLLALEIEAVVRGLRTYLAPGDGGTLEFAQRSSSAAPEVSPRARATAASASTAPRQDGRGSSQGQRTERQRIIKDTLASLGQAGIKDISDRISEYSEKTIQRELVLMVAQGQIIKDGERRWSRYSLAHAISERVL